MNQGCGSAGRQRALKGTRLPVPMWETELNSPVVPIWTTEANLPIALEGVFADLKVPALEGLLADFKVSDGQTLIHGFEFIDASALLRDFEIPNMDEILGDLKLPIVRPELINQIDIPYAASTLQEAVSEDFAKAHGDEAFEDIATVGRLFTAMTDRSGRLTEEGEADDGGTIDLPAVSFVTAAYLSLCAFNWMLVHPKEWALLGDARDAALLGMFLFAVFAKLGTNGE